jgi:hypothetical protein
MLARKQNIGLEFVYASVCIASLLVRPNLDQPLPADLSSDLVQIWYSAACAAPSLYAIVVLSFRVSTWELSPVRVRDIVPLMRRLLLAAILLYVRRVRPFARLAAAAGVILPVGRLGGQVVDLSTALDGSAAAAIGAVALWRTFAHEVSGWCVETNEQKKPEHTCRAHIMAVPPLS